MLRNHWRLYLTYGIYGVLKQNVFLPLFAIYPTDTCTAVRPFLWWSINSLTSKFFDSELYFNAFKKHFILFSRLVESAVTNCWIGLLRVAVAWCDCPFLSNCAAVIIGSCLFTSHQAWSRSWVVVRRGTRMLWGLWFQRLDWKVILLIVKIHQRHCRCIFF